MGQNVAIELDYVNPLTTRMMGEGVFDPRWQFSRSSDAWVMNRNCEIEKVPADVPRAAYNSAGQGDGGTGTWRGWLFEPQRTNSLLRSNPDAATPTGWVSNVSGGSGTRTLTSAFGLNAVRSTITSAQINGISDTVKLGSASEVICVSMYVNADTFTGDPDAVLIDFSAFAGATTDTSLATFANADSDGRIRAYITLSSDTTGDVKLGPGADGSAAAVGVYEYTGWQAEVVPNTSSLPTSLIVTTSSTVTRNADSAIIDGADYDALDDAAGGTFSTGSGSISVDAEFLNPTANEWWSALSDGTTSDQIRYGSSTSNLPRREMIDGGASQADQTAITSYPGNRVNFLLSTINVINVNGTNEAVSLTGSQPTVDQWEIGDNVNGAAAVVVKNLWLSIAASGIDTGNGFEKDGEFKGTERVSLAPVDDFLPRLVEAPLYEIEPELWIWGNRGKSAVGDIELVNVDHALDLLLGFPVTGAANTYTMRGQQARVYIGENDAAFSSYTQVAELEIDFAGVSDAGNIRVAFAGLDVDLCRPIQNFVYDGAPNSTIDGDPYPITLGRCRQVPAVDFSPGASGGPIYHVHDEVFSETSFTISEVQSNGNPALSTQWAVVDYGFQFNISPSGKITAYISQGVFGTDTEEIVQGLIGAGSAYSRARFIDYNATELSAVCSAFSNPINGIWLDRSASVKSVLNWMLQPFLIWTYVDANGQLRFGRLEDPDTISGTPVLTIDQTNIVEATTIKPEDDLMPGLTDRLGGRKNWHPIPKESVATGLSLDDQATVAAEFRISSKIGRGQLASAYRWAENGEPFETGLDDQTDLDAARDNLLDIAKQRRRFWRATIAVDEIPQIEPGDLVTIQFPGYELDSGEDFQVVGVAYRWGGNVIELKLWG